MTTPEASVVCGPLVAGGDALVRRPGERTLFVEGGIPGEAVTVEIKSTRKDVAFGRVVDVLEPATERIAAPCPFFARGCGGCQWQHISFGAQAGFKVEIVRDALARIAKRPEAPVRLAGSVPEFGYRTNMRFAVEADGSLCLHRKHSDELVQLDFCLIAHPLLDELIRSGRYEGAEEVTLRVSSSSGERLALVHGETGNIHVPSDVVVHKSGRNATITEEVLGRKYRISARSFFQDGPDAAQLIASAVDAAIPRDASWVVDAYAGVGVLGGTVAASRNCSLTLLEQSPWATKDARINLADLDAEVIEAEVAKVRFAGNDSPDAVIADPARTGLGPSAAHALTQLGAPRIVLVSCDPASLARDTVLLATAGYTLIDVAVLDVFPQTHHVETVSTFDLTEH